jgi:DNA-binding Xre family transcriptional regulator/predicted RNase H-like HicB family nuclease
MRYIALFEKDGNRTHIEFPGLEGCTTFAEKTEDSISVAQEALVSWLRAELIRDEIPPSPSPTVAARRGAKRQPVSVPPGLATQLQMRWIRAERRISQGELARRMGVSRQQVSRIETSDGNLTYETVERVARALGVEFWASLK